MSYFTYEEIVTAVQLLCDEYSTKTQLLRLPNLSVQSRPIYAIAIGETRGKNRRTAIIVGGVHAREWVPPDALVSLSADLLEASVSGTGLRYGGAYFDKETISRILADLQLVVLPCANPDGRVYSQEVDPNWRKNRAPVGSRGRSICYGVDLNRNFSVAWDFHRCFAPESGVSASDDPCDYQVYVGPTAGSEPETRNIVWLLDHFVKTEWFVDVHASWPAVFHNWGLDKNQTVRPEQNFLNSIFDGKRGIDTDAVYGEYIESSDLDEANRLSRVMGDTIRLVHGDNYDVGQSFSLYPTSGASDDYAYGRHRENPALSRVLGFTMECGHNFQPNWQTREKVIQEVSAALVGLASDVSRSSLT